MFEALCFRFFEGFDRCFFPIYGVMGLDGVLG